MDNWKKQIAIAHFVKQRVAEVDVQGMWPYHLPELAATEDELCAAEQMLGERLDEKYRDFLGHANGWQAFFQAIDLFSTKDLVGGKRWEKANEILTSLENTNEVCGFLKNDLLPIGVSQYGIDIFLMTKKTSGQPGLVFWVAGQLVDQYPDFDEFFLAMVDYNREEAASLEGQKDV